MPEDVLVNAHSSKLAEAMPLMTFTERGGQKFLPLNAIVFFLGRLGWVEDRSLAIDLTAGLSPATPASFEAWAVADKRRKQAKQASCSASSRCLLTWRLASCPQSSKSLKIPSCLSKGTATLRAKKL